ncbi:MAG: hypothetical protein AAFQ68_21985 [Bacteroidota bacterium]
MMKLMQTLIVLVAVMGTFAPSLAQTEATTSSSNVNSVDVVAHQKEGVWMVTYQAETPGVVHIRLYDAWGNMIHRTRLADQQLFTKAFSLASLPNGDYTFVVSSPEGTYRETVGVQQGRKASPLDIDLVPLPGSQKYQLVVSGTEASEVEVQILSPDATLLYEESTEKNSLTSRIYNLEQVREDQVVFVVSAGDRRTVEAVNLK